MRRPAPVSVYLLGGAGLLPPALLIAAFFTGLIPPIVVGVGAIGYAALILSFIGGAWWGMGAAGQGRAGLFALAVVPSLVGYGAVAATVMGWRHGGTLIAMALLGTLFVDQLLTARRLAPPWWMRLRIPLSLSLAALTLAAQWLWLVHQRAALI